MKSKTAHPVYTHAQKDAKMVAAAARKEAKVAFDVAKAKLKEAERVVDKKIQTHPEQAVIIAGAIGAAIGALAAYGIMHGSKKK